MNPKPEIQPSGRIDGGLDGVRRAKNHAYQIAYSDAPQDNTVLRSSKRHPRMNLFSNARGANEVVDE